MWREIPGVIVYIAFLTGFVFLMNYISSTTFNGSPNFYTFVAACIIIFATLMVYWERIFPTGD